MKISFWNRTKNQSPLTKPSPIDQVDLDNKNEEERIERAKLILDFSKEQYDYALDRTKSIEDKALKVFSTVSVIVTAYIFLVRYVGTIVLKAAHSWVYYLAISTGALTLVAISVAWVFVFRSVRLKDIPIQEYGPATDDYVFDNKRDVSTWGLARRYSEAAASVDKRHTRKAKFVGLSIVFTGATGLFFIIFVLSCLYMAYEQEVDMFGKPKPEQERKPLPSYQVRIDSPIKQVGSASGSSMRPARVDAPALRMSLESLDSIIKAKA
ncbi:hypothetical protein [Pantoea agglomerans]|uniref:hypothetical protein n=1 Tax=Enterobacter agglomerans TaxID=549 RepID=UPI0015588DF0|nr:hypothetical protein [Pantoea agglomerans]NQS80543.1 hypothetical protein [Pantoea agglomerans]